MSRPILLLFALFVLNAQNTALVPARILPQIEAKCSTAKQYLFEGEILLQGQRGSDPGRLLAKARVRLAVGAEGRSYLHLTPVDKDEYLLVSDGKKSWAYVPKLKQYTEQESATVANDADDDGGGSGASDEERDLAAVFAYQVMPILSRIASTAGGADVHGTAPIRFEGRKADWPVVRVITRKDGTEGTTLAELALEPATLDIGRLVWTNVSYSANVKVLMRMTVDFTTFRIGELPDDTFAFDPPKKAKLVETLPIPGQSGSFLLNKPAPDFELKTIDGERIRLADLRGKPVVLNFWASWCGPCRRELPRLAKLYEEFKEQGLVVLGVNDEGRSEARRYSEQAKLTFRTLDDSGLKAHRLYRVYSIPSVFVIDREGKVVRFLKGAHDEPDLRAALKTVGL